MTFLDLTLLDLLVVLLLAAAALSGWRAGLLRRAGAWLGVLVGLAASVWTVTATLRWLENEPANLRFVAALVVFATTMTVTTTLLGRLGGALGRRVADTPLQVVDRSAGAVAGVALVAVMTWLALPLAAAVPGPLAHQATDARITSLLDEHAPPTPQLGETVRALVAETRFPEVVAELAPVRPAGPPPDDLAVPPEVLDRARASTVRVSARGCGVRYDGSGVTIAAGTVLTNAHVVAGSDRVEVRRPDGQVRSARVVAFDPRRDLALLEVADLGQQHLPLSTTSAGAEAAVIGYPGGQPDPRITAVRVQQQRSALGRDIHGAEETERDVLFLAAALRQGDSGAPVIDTTGAVVGLVFAISPDQPTTAYALDRREIDAILAAPRVTGATGRCLAVTPSS